MAEIITAVRRPHPCRVELGEIDSPELLPGTIAECSCGLRWKKKDSQRDGAYWAQMATDAVQD